MVQYRFANCTVTADNPLAKDLAAYEAELPKLLGDAGKFAVFHDGKLIAVFDIYEQALTKGYEIAGLKPSLVQQISPIPVVQHFSRALKLDCLTSPSRTPPKGR